MRFRRFGDRYLLRLESGEPAMETLTTFLSKDGIEFAYLSAAGALRSVRLGYWNAGTRSYDHRDFDQQLEVLSFQGNAALKDGKPFLHVHGVFGRPDFSVIGGHVEEGRVHPTLEVWLRTEAVAVRRERDPATGLDLLELPE
jgi:predicted DNA-binding protein with PD1-like motif